MLCVEQALKYIKNNTIIGLGAGRNIACMIKLISEADLKIRIVTPSDNTRKMCIECGSEVIQTFLSDKIDMAFDGCGEIDKNFYALCMI